MPVRLRDLPVTAKTAVFSREGEYWVIGYTQSSFLVRDLKGLSYVQHLLRYPNQEFHCLGLLGGLATSNAESWGESDKSAAPRLSGDSISVHAPGDSGPMLDDQARAAYRRRIIELKEEQEDCSERGDDTATDRIQSEIDAVTLELTRAIGLGGRVRRMGSTSERARLSVGRAIRMALAAISQHDPQLGAILGRDVRTGSFCEYVPGQSNDPIVWQFATSRPQPADQNVMVPRADDDAPPVPRLTLAREFNWVLDSGPFIGRDKQRSILAGNLELARSGSGRVVTISGEAGVGKTRLSREFCADASKAGFFAMAGSCYDAEDAVPFVPYTELLESALAQSASPDAFRDALGPDGIELFRLMPGQAAKISGIGAPQEVPPQQARRLLFNSMVAVVKRVSAQLPLLLLIEDLHWADEGTLALVVHLARAVANLPVMIIANYRDEHGGSAESVGHVLYELSRLPYAEHIKLLGLPGSEVAALLQALSEKTPPQSLVEAMRSATEGNPLFILELWEHLAEGGQLFGPDGRFRKDLTLEQIDVPQGIRLLLARRLSLLAPETLTILLYAATIGKSFAFDLLVQSVGIEADTLLDHVEKAEQIGLLDSALENREARFYFSHELVRQVVLEEISAPRAQRVHLRVADGIEKLYAGALEDHASELANHLMRAGNLADADRSINYLTMAARKELGQGASTGALRHMSYALELFSSQPQSKRSPQQELWLQLLYGSAVAAVNGWAALEAGHAFERAQALCAAMGDPPELFQILGGLNGFHVLRADFRSSLSLVGRVSQMAEQLNNDTARIGSHWFRGCTLFFLGNLLEARDELERGIALHHSRKGDSQELLSFGEDGAAACLTYSALAGWCLGKADWRSQQQEAIERARSLDHPFTTVWTITNLCIANIERYDWAEVVKLADEGQKLADKYGFDLFSVSLDLYRYDAIAGQGQAEGIDGVRRVLATCKAMGVKMLMPCAHTIIADFLGEAGVIDEAHAELDVAFAEMNLTEERQYEAESHRIRGELHLRECKRMEDAESRDALTGKAEHCFLTASSIAQSQGAFAFEVRSTLSLARLWMVEGKSAEARKLLEALCSRCADGWSSPELEQAKNLIADNSSAP
jgi:hypothetical protein